MKSGESRQPAVRVRKEADLVFAPGDVISIVPTKLSGTDPERPGRILWTGVLNLAPKAVEELRIFGGHLQPGDQILISRDGEPLDVTFPRLVGQFMSVGNFSSYDDLVGALGGIGAFEKNPQDLGDVFSAKELEMRHKDREALQKSESMLREAEQIREDAAAGRISEEEMMRRVNQLRQ